MPETQPARIYAALACYPAEPGWIACSRYIIAARTHVEAAALARANISLSMCSEVYITTDATAEIVGAVTATGRSDNKSTLADHARWVEAMTRDRWIDGRLKPATFARVVMPCAATAEVA